MNHFKAHRGALLAALLLASCGGTPSTKTATATDGVSSGPSETPTATEAESKTGKALTDTLLSQWQQAHPDRNWAVEVRRSHPGIPESADNSAVVGVDTGQGEGQTYGRFTEQDVATWKQETETLVLAGARIFHSGDELGTTVAVSCDMCHPDAANTHPETYPKFQSQMGRVAHLRDMINWCLINPVRAEPLEPDDPKMRALEAYIYAQRKGTPLEFGKH